jgi:hypothetical protein
MRGFLFENSVQAVSNEFFSNMRLYKLLKSINRIKFVFNTLINVIHLI